jgi:hypothetical protein
MMECAEGVDESSLLAHVNSAYPRFYVWGVSRSFLSVSHFLYIVFERFVLPGKNVDARLGVGSDFAVEDLVVHRNLTNAELNDGFPRFLDCVRGQRACECKGEESDKDDEKSKALHAGRVEIEERERKVMSSKAGRNRTGRDPIFARIGSVDI